MTANCPHGFGNLSSRARARSNSRLLCISKFLRCASAALSIVGTHPRPESDAFKPHQPHFLAQQHNLHEQVAKFLRVFASKFTERAVIDRHPLGQPLKVDPHLQSFFQFTAGPNSADQAVDNHATKDPRMNRRLAEPTMIGRLRRLPIQSIQQRIDDADVMVEPNDVIEFGGNEKELVSILSWHCRSHPDSLPCTRPRNARPTSYPDRLKLRSTKSTGRHASRLTLKTPS